ncbi:MAG: Na+/H+ antiporter NhaA [Candidatus Electrothrix sp. ATG2]|nr:Na+/H+ antiporter NhaA [Candidatus Electrothrix sp. ATG2]
MKSNQETFIYSFFKLESSGGIVLLFAAVLAFICANTQLQSYNALFLEIPVEIRVGGFEIAKPLLLWINDGLMALFFFFITLELKREILEGELADRRNIILPALGAIGGMVVPALIYTFFNATDPVAMKGWAVPAVTSLPFSLAILSLLGERVSTGIKVFLTSLAIFTDIGAIILIAFLYTASISVLSLVVVACCIVFLVWLNRRNPEEKSPYILAGIIMWVAMLKSGVHATLAGVVLALFIPMVSKHEANVSPLKNIADDLHCLVAFFVLPVFAFANAGINISGIGPDYLLHDVPLGIALGLFIGKQVGIFGSCWFAVQCRLTSLPEGMSWKTLYGTAALGGIGFTMSLFVGSLAFEETGIDITFDERLGIILGSLASGLVGYLVLRMYLPSSVQSITHAAEESAEEVNICETNLAAHGKSKKIRA